MKINNSKSAALAVALKWIYWSTAGGLLLQLISIIKWSSQQLLIHVQLIHPSISWIIAYSLLL